MKLRIQINTKMIKNYVIIGLVCLCSFTGFSQSVTTNGVVVKEITIVENMSIAITVDSADDLESTFKVENIKEIIEDLGEDETIAFKVTCNGKKMSNGVKSHISFKIDGNSDDSEGFLKSVEKIRTAAINYYNKK